jgi:adenylate cyclase
LERKLTAILCADVYGYSRLMGDDEEATLRTLNSHRQLIDSILERHDGRFVSSARDSVLAEFASVVEAVHCAVEIQAMLNGRERESAGGAPDGFPHRGQSRRRLAIIVGGSHEAP